MYHTDRMIALSEDVTVSRWDLKRAVSKVKPQAITPFLNIYSHKGEVLSSSGYYTPGQAFFEADKSYYKDYDQIPPYKKTANAGENNVQFLGVLDIRDYTFTPYRRK